MNKKEFLGLMSVLCFAGILFTYQGSKSTSYLLIFGLVFGCFWFFKK